MSFPEAARCACPGYKVLLNRQLQNPDCSGFLLPSLLRRLGHRLFEGIHRTEAVIINRTPVQR